MRSLWWSVAEVKFSPRLGMRLLSFMGALSFLLLTSCGVPGLLGQRKPDQSAFAPQPPPHDDIIVAMRREVEGEILQKVGSNQATVLTTMASAKAVSAHFKQPLAVETLNAPWTGLIALEEHAQRMANLVRDGSRSIPALIDVMERGLSRSQGSIEFPSAPGGMQLDDHLDFIQSVLERAHTLRLLALAGLTPEEQKFLFEHARLLSEEFYPHFDGVAGVTLQQAKNDLRFATLVAERLDYPNLVVSAQVLSRLADAEWLRRLGQIFHSQRVPPRTVQGVEGGVLAVRETPFGLIIIGGQEPNTYTMNVRHAVVIDIGGNDSYDGTIAAPTSLEEGNRVVIDLSGNDTYVGTQLGLATGRLSVGLLVDLEGDDQYELANGSGGAGFAGLGLLIDDAGNDQYRGAKLTQGAAIAGLGLLLDGAGNDVYSSFGYSIGFGGPLGVGAVIDVAGEDRYQCGDKYPSSYNEADVPSGDPEDPLFQYDGFCVGVGAGKRILTSSSEQQGYSLAGGMGIVIEVEGDDSYKTANFSQGAGYFFGVGVKLDFYGDDQHWAARYGHGAAAHYGVGLFIEAQGKDRYTSSGPVYNCATAWDQSVTLCIDSGQEDDFYDFTQSDGLGRADHSSWSVFIEAGGQDHYFVTRGFGLTSADSMSGFFDLSGDDEYVSVSREVRVGNGLTSLREPGGLFVDR